MMPVPLLSIDGLSIGFANGPGTPTPTLADVSVSVERGETVCLLGESGSGKSLTCLAALDILPPSARVLAGSVRFEGRAVSEMSPTEKRFYRGGRAAMVFQDPVGALNPAHRIGPQIEETLRLHRKPVSAPVLVSLLKRVGLAAPERVLGAYPHELSGGMNQRVMIAMALAGDPDLLIADEPTTALDATIQAQILDLIAEIQAERGLAVLLVTHDIGVAAEMADRIVVMRHGRVVESGSAVEVLTKPTDPYTQSLIAAAEFLDGGATSARSAS